MDKDVRTVLAPAVLPALMKASLDLRPKLRSFRAAVAAFSSSSLPGNGVKESSITLASSTTKRMVLSRRLVW